jgi:multidrug efflux pump subunit AcrA (membrane-fusion protein)
VRQVPVKTGRTHEGFIEMVDGTLKPGDVVVVTGNETLQDQAQVAIKPALRH